MTDRRLIVMRHAKAEAFATSDHDRVLVPRGVADATAAGRWAAENDLLPDHVVVSSAARTQGTWSAFAAASGSTVTAVTDRSLYSADTDGALEIIRTVPAEARTVMLVGHNPTMEYLVHLLDDGDADPELFAALSAGYPTATLAVLELAEAWAAVDVGSARMVSFHIGRGEKAT